MLSMKWLATKPATERSYKQEAETASCFIAGRCGHRPLPCRSLRSCLHAGEQRFACCGARKNIRTFVCSIFSTCCGTQNQRPLVFSLLILTTATHSASFLCRRQQSPHSPRPATRFARMHPFHRPIALRLWLGLSGCHSPLSSLYPPGWH